MTKMYKTFNTEHWRGFGIFETPAHVCYTVGTTIQFSNVFSKIYYI